MKAGDGHEALDMGPGAQRVRSELSGLVVACSGTHEGAARSTDWGVPILSTTLEGKHRFSDGEGRAGAIPVRVLRWEPSVLAQRPEAKQTAEMCGGRWSCSATLQLHSSG